MYAVIAAGGKQHRVSAGQRLNVELLGQPDGSEVQFTPVLLVDGKKVLATPDELANASVVGQVVGQVKGPKINGFTYKNASNNRRRWGHRQQYNTVEITQITKG